MENTIIRKFGISRKIGKYEIRQFGIREKLKNWIIRKYEYLNTRKFGNLKVWNSIIRISRIWKLKKIKIRKFKNLKVPKFENLKIWIFENSEIWNFEKNAKISWENTKLENLKKLEIQ